MRDDAELVIAARSGDRDAFGPLVERWFDRCWEVAWRILRDRDLAADVAQDTLLVAWQQLDRLQQPGSFGGWVLRITRNRALDRLAHERRAVPTGDERQLEPAVRGDDPTGPEAALARAEQRDLVWAAAAALGERDVSILDLHLRHGLEPHELADELEITPNAAHQALFRLRGRLGQAVRAWLLWRGDDAACVMLRAELAAAGQQAFGPSTVRTIRRHVAACDTCAEEHDRVAAPAALFAAVPLVGAPALARAQAFASLADAGVPVGDGYTETAGDGGAGSGDSAASSGSGEHAPTARADARRAGSHETARHATVRRADGVTRGSARGAPVQTIVALALVAVIVTGGWLWWRAATSQPAPAEGEPAPTEEVFVVTVPVETPTPAPPPVVVAPPPDPPAQPRPDEQAPEPSAPPSEVVPPRIISLRVIHRGACDGDRRNAGRYEVAWTSAGADSASLVDADQVVTDVPVSGTAERCAVNGDVFTLNVVGPGGAATRSMEAASTTPP